MISLTCGILNQHKTKNQAQRHKEQIDARDGREGDKIDESGQKLQTSNYKINKPWGYNVQHGNCSYYSTAYLKVAKRVNLKKFSSQQTFGLCGRRRGWDVFDRTASKHVNYQG